MRLDLDCVRDVLLAVEACDFSEFTNIEKLAKVLPGYSEEDLWYTCLKLGEGDYLSLLTIEIPGSYRPGVKAVVDLTYQGHEFLNTIRDGVRFQKAKRIAGGLKDFSLSALRTISEGIAAAAITATLQRGDLL